MPGKEDLNDAILTSRPDDLLVKLDCDRSEVCSDRIKVSPYLKKKERVVSSGTILGAASMFNRQ
jgi:hypothetical protein